MSDARSEDEYERTEAHGETSRARRAFLKGGVASIVDLPVGCSIFTHKIFRAPRSWAERVFPHLIYWNELDRGGHFAAFEQPALFD